MVKPMDYTAKIKTILRRDGWTQQKLAQTMGVSQSTVARWVSGVEPEKARRDQIDELYSNEVGPENSVPLMGFVGAGAEIMPEFEQIPADGIEHIEVPFPLPDDMIAFEIRGDSMLPIYKDKAIIICYREQKRPLEAFYGEEAAVRTSDGKRYIKTITRGADGVNLSSFNAPMIESVQLEWIGEIFAVLPRSHLRAIQRSGGIQGKLRLRA
jgi:phage repressor protein C with HTH and peptisase S24 domain